ncbi:KEOPS complex subunit Pcc1 [Halorubrum sp. N11]|uniref:KEOPS complex subunit Pcc1 n=1 Tax=Halorubrum sp. N11 TaxID=3402276 RepID=UPI003EB7843A
MTADRAHETVLSFRYRSERHARLVGDALEPEIGEIDDDRSAATVSRDGDTVRVRVGADDLAALRAGINSWSRLVAVAERVGTERDRQ